MTPERRKFLVRDMRETWSFASPRHARLAYGAPRDRIRMKLTTAPIDVSVQSSTVRTANDGG